MIATLAVRRDRFCRRLRKMAKQRSLGLTGKQKLLGQLLIAIGVWIGAFHFDQVFRRATIRGTSAFRF